MVNFHKEKAIRLLTEHRESHADPNSPMACKCQCSKFPRDGTYTYKEINHVMARVVDENGSPELVHALVQLGADVNNVRRTSSNLWKKVTRKHQQPERSDLLQNATIRCRPALVDALAGKADQANLDNALHYAILRRDLDILDVLLRHGADPAELHDDFEKALICSETGLIAMLLRGPKRPCLDCRSSGLVMAVQNGSSEILDLLIGADADPNHGAGKALVAAVEARRPDFLQRMVDGTVSTSAESLDIALGVAYQQLGGRDDETCLQLLEICICAGARGDRTERLYTSGLVNCVKRRQLKLFDIILQHSRPVDPYHTLSVLESIKSNQTSILKRLIKLNPTHDCVNSAIGQAMKVQDSEVMYGTVALLLSLGPAVRPASEALVQCVRRASANSSDPDTFHIALLKLLLGKGNADVNYGQGEALRLAITANLKEAIWDIMDKGPVMSTLEAALPVAMAMNDPTQKLVVVEMLLLSGLRGPVVDKALVQAVRARSPTETSSLVELLLTQASVNHNEGEALVCAIRQQDFEILKLILARSPDRNAMFSAANAALQLTSKSDRRETIRELIPRFQTEHLNLCLKHAVVVCNAPSNSGKDMGLVELALDAGAEADCERGVCISTAALAFDLTLLRLLADKAGRNERVFTDVLSQLISQGDAWLSPSHIETVELVLSYGASGPVVSRALIDAVRGLTSGGGSRQYVPEALFDLLLSHGADVNHADGEAMLVASKQGDRHVLRKLLALANRTTATAALFVAISSGHTEARLLELLEVFTDRTTTKPDFNATLPGGKLPPLYLCLQFYPGSTVLLNRMIGAGCDLQKQVPCIVYGPPPEDSGRRRSHGTEDFGEEQVSVLVWALVQPDCVVSSAVINELAEQGGNVTFTTPKSKTTPLILAVRSRRSDCVDKLLRLGASASQQDALGQSPLFYASRIGCHQSAVLILQKRVPVNDGSLHEASRYFHLDVMEQLVTAGHDADFRSIKHGGHTALTVMAGKGIVPSNDPSRAEAAVDLLKRSSASPLAKVHNKTAIFYALDSEDAESISRLLLDRILWKTINDESNVFHDGEYFYSPTMYVAKGLFRGPQGQAEALLALLRAQGAIDRFYAPIEHEQPDDAVGMPEEIREFEKDVRARRIRVQREEEDHARQLAREEETVMQKVRLTDHVRYAELNYSDEVASRRRLNRGLDHGQDMQIDQDKQVATQTQRMREAVTTSSIDRLKHRDGEAMRLATREADLSHRVRERSIKGWEDHLEMDTQARRHAHSLQQRAGDASLESWRGRLVDDAAHRRDRRAADMRERAAIGETFTMRQRDDLQAGKDSRAMMASWAAHRMKMEERGVETWISTASPSGGGRVLGEVSPSPPPPSSRRMITG